MNLANHDRALTLLDEGKKVTATKVSAVLGVGTSHARRILKELADEGLAQCVGQVRVGRRLQDAYQSRACAKANGGLLTLAASGRLGMGAR